MIVGGGTPLIITDLNQRVAAENTVGRKSFVFQPSSIAAQGSPQQNGGVFDPETEKYMINLKNVPI